ncbi:hypothetical protein ON010_g6341 [Phytophthora cinnamomi]|nr:hypothetical protein ON010_g6341 [Phytophthora cinnamomi]
MTASREVFLKRVQQGGHAKQRRLSGAFNFVAGEDGDEVLGGVGPPVENEAEAVRDLGRDRAFHNPSEAVHGMD